MTRDGFSCFIGFLNFPGEDPQAPFLKIEKYVIYFFLSSTAQQKPLVQSEVFKLGSQQQE